MESISNLCYFTCSPPARVHNAWLFDQVFVGGLRESEDAVHITEEELATYFAKFGVIESVSINRDDRTQRGRGFAFVKFFQEVGGSCNVLRLCASCVANSKLSCKFHTAVRGAQQAWCFECTSMTEWCAWLWFGCKLDTSIPCAPSWPCWSRFLQRKSNILLLPEKPLCKEMLNYPFYYSFAFNNEQAAALNAVVADASTHVIRGTTVSVQWSRGAKDGGGGPRRRNSATAIASSGIGSSPSRGSSRSSSKLRMFPHKGTGGRGGSGSGPCGVSCNHGFSPMRSRNMGHMHTPTGGGAVPYGFGGGRHGDHHNQPMVSCASDNSERFVRKPCG